MPSNSDRSMDATFLFKGSIRAVKSSTVPGIPLDETIVVAMVDQVLEAPTNLAKMSGRRVTVKLSGRRKVAVGDELIFHAHGWIFGASVAVQSLKEELIRETRVHAALLSRGGDPVVHRRNRQVKHRFSAADVVVSGRVMMVRIPPETASSAGAASKSEGPENTPQPIGPISEHTPHWREAHVEIDDVHKGVHTSRTVVVRFPASRRRNRHRQKKARRVREPPRPGKKPRLRITSRRCIPRTFNLTPNRAECAALLRATRTYSVVR